ncbi:MAG: VOC family protein [Chitinophagaceae bacterium]
MEKHVGITSIGSHFAQIAWVVNDIQSAEKFFREVIGIPGFVKMENLHAENIEGTYYGKPGDYSFHLYLAYSGETLLELIQPVSGQSIFRDYLEKNPQGGVQHIAYMVPVSELSGAVADLTNKGYQVIQSLTLPVAQVVFFDTQKDIGVVTEIIGITEAGIEFLSQLKKPVDV